MITKTSGEASLTDVEQALVDHVTRGELLDLAADEPVDEAAMRTWDSSRTIRAAVVRDILRGRLATDPDPHGLRLRGARIASTPTRWASGRSPGVAVRRSRLSSSRSSSRTTTW